MSGIAGGVVTVFGLGAAYFLAAIPAGAALKVPLPLAVLSAWSGYMATAVLMVLVGTPARRWLAVKFKLSTEPRPEKMFWRVWMRWGLPGLGLLAPVTCGPYIAALLALALGEKPGRVLFWIAVGVLPWCAGFALLALTGVQLFKP